MSLVEIDTLIYMKCRLCLEESGMYQIVPTVRDQISYCFNINIDPFDGLSQIICKKCQLVLNDYSKTKATYTEKQEKLKLRKLDSNVTQPVVKLQNSGALNSLNIQLNGETNNLKKIKHKRRRLVSSSSDESKKDIADTPSKEASPEPIKKANKKWKAKYQKTYLCRLCHSSWSSKKTVLNHKKIHQSLVTQYANVIKNSCTVSLAKIDDKPNLTGSNKHVVYSKKKIIAMGNEDYYIAYKYKKSAENSDETNNVHEYNNDMEISDTSSQSNYINQNSKVRRSSSRSSTDTVVLDNKNNGSITNECISIDDSDSTDENETKRKRKLNINKIDMVPRSAVNRIISNSLSKFIKQNEHIDKPTLEQLNRKLISIGRQIINRKGFNSNRLMKYLDHLNLNIIWLARPPLSVTNNSNYYKIIPRARYSSEKTSNDFEGYKKKYVKPNISNLEIASSEQQLETTSEESHRLGSSTADEALPPFLMKKLLNIEDNSHCKLLNSNPVANPRQLKVKKFKPAASMPSLELKSGEDKVMSNYPTQMPIITNTTSLAETSQKDNECSKPAESAPATSQSITKPVSVPRLKVKSVESLNRMNEPANVNTSNGMKNNLFPFQTLVPPQNENSDSLTDEYVVLDTVELPNTKTSSPFNYFRMLLQVHNLKLLDTEASLSPEFLSLIRFKVLYKQENKEQPVFLCLTLLYCDNTFCLKIKDRNHHNINMSKVSANWQWEILKICKGDVVSKLLENAEKIGSEVYNKTNSFLCLLKSIKFIPK